MTDDDPTIAELLKTQGYVTGQFGKNHLGDRDSMLPTNHGFDEFFGNLYHLNAEQEPENSGLPQEPGIQEEVRPARRHPQLRRRPHHGHRAAHEEAHEDDRREVTEKALDFMERAVKADKPFFLWWNSTRMHIWTHLKEESDGKTGLGVYADGMVEHDGHVGQVLDKLESARHRPTTRS